jgi:hypothetical protein
MFRQSIAFVSRRGVFTALFAALLSTSAFAQAPATDLGQAWPNATDVSLSPHYHAYVFLHDGIRYVQVNNLNGTVLGAVAVVDNVVLVLPMGLDAKYVTTQHEPAAGNAGAAETVYSDGNTLITASTTSTGAVQINVATTPSPAPASAPGICTNPANCNGVVNGG